jgi:hypothetical protein
LNNRTKNKISFLIFSHRIGRFGLAISLITYEGRFSGHKIEQELGTKILPVSCQIEENLYVVKAPVIEQLTDEQQIDKNN